jgi:PPOX class probable F420-dependent enzyme
MEPAEARTRFAGARVARLATTGADRRPHIVPVVFALDGDTLYTAVDDVKPKATTRLKRLANIAANPAVALLADHYEDEDWSRLAWLQVRGEASLVEDAAERERALAALRARYRQYHTMALEELPLLRIRPTRLVGWNGARFPVSDAGFRGNESPPPKPET